MIINHQQHEYIFPLLMELLFFPELFCLISINLNDKEKIFLTSCSKIIYNYKSLLILDSEYNLEEINDIWRVKNIIIKEFSLENKIKELIRDLIPESIVVNSKYVKFISNNANIKLFHNEEIIKKLVSHECSNEFRPRPKALRSDKLIPQSIIGSYLAMKIMLNNDKSINNVNKQFLKSSWYGYLDVMKLLIELGADICANRNEAIIVASCYGHLDIVKLLIDYGANVKSLSNRAIISASRNGHLFVVKLLIDSGADVRAQNNQAITYASLSGHLSVVKLLIENGADFHAQNNRAIISASRNGYLSVVKLLMELGADIHAQNNAALRYAVINNHSDIIDLLKKINC